MLSLLVLVLSQTPAAPPESTVWVALARKQGVAAAAATAQLADVAAQLTAARISLAAGPDDITSCQRKLACIVKAARDRRASWVVLVEVARVLEQAIVKIDVISVEDDGRKLASTVYDGLAASSREQVAAKVEADLLPTLRRLGAPAPPPPPPVIAPPPVVVAVPEPAPPPLEPQPRSTPVAVVAEPAPLPRSPLRPLGFVSLALGVGGLGSAGVLGVLTLQEVGKRDQLCPPSLSQCNDPAALAAHNRAATWQDAGIVAASIGAVALCAGALLLFLGMHHPGGGEL